jgi:hypothetical protein
MRVPEPRGVLTAFLADALRREPAPLSEPPAPAPGDPLDDEDLQLSLYMLYELHYRGVEGVDERWEWEPSLLALRRGLEDSFESGLRAEVPRRNDLEPGEVPDALLAAVREDDAPPVSRFLQSAATLEQFREFVIHRSAYQLKEADPHTFSIPRLWGPAKAALVEVQADEYGEGRPERMHSAMFARTMRALDLDDSYGAYVDRIPGATLATVNLITMFGLHRRLRGACAGHLAVFESSSSLPNRRYGDGLRRLGLGEAATAFYDEHVEADAVHENLAIHDLAGGLARQEPQLAPDIVWGGEALLALDARVARRQLSAWESGKSSLRPAAVAAPA